MGKSHLVAALAREVHSWLDSGADDMEMLELAANGWEGVFIVKGGQILRRYDGCGSGEMLDDPFHGGISKTYVLKDLGEMGVTVAEHAAAAERIPFRLCTSAIRWDAQARPAM